MLTFEARVECANCGGLDYHLDAAPPRGAVQAYAEWLDKLQGEWRAQTTRLGFYAWCSSLCEHVWKEARYHALEDRHHDGFAHQHGIEMDRRALASGAY